MFCTVLFSSLEAGNGVQNPRLNMLRYNTLPFVALFAIEPPMPGDLRWRLAGLSGHLVGIQGPLAIIPNNTNQRIHHSNRNKVLMLLGENITYKKNESIYSLNIFLLYILFVLF